MTLGIALLGTGNIAQHAFIPAVQAVDGARLVAVLSRDKARGAIFAQQYGIPEVYDDLGALLQSPRVDAVIVASPDAMHESQVIAAAQAGKHVLCEKPMTTTYAGCQRMAETIRASGITFAMGYNNRFSNGLQRIKAMIDEGQIGQVRYARAFLTAAAQDPQGWRAHSEQSRYWALSAVGTHVIDLWRWYFGEPASIGGGIASPVYQSPNDEVSVAGPGLSGALAGGTGGRRRLSSRESPGALWSGWRHHCGRSVGRTTGRQHYLQGRGDSLSAHEHIRRRSS